MTMKKVIIFLLSLLLSISGCSSQIDVEPTKPTGTFELQVLDVGQGLSVLVESDGHYLLYDGGGRSASSYVVSYLENEGIEKFDYIIASHYDEDHIAGLVGVLNVFACDLVLDPDYETDSQIYASFKNKVKNEKHPELKETYQLGSASFEIIGPIKEYGEDNDKSICIRITFGNTHYLICGDASIKAEQDMLNEDIQSDVYIVSHHGSKYSSSQEFIQKVNPKYAIISCGLNNSYGHPDQEVLNNLSQCEIYRTDTQHEIICTSDGTNVTFEQKEQNVTYVCNKNSKKFHRPDCSSLDSMKEENKYYTSNTREQLIQKGYGPCGLCKP